MAQSSIIFLVVARKESVIQEIVEQSVVVRLYD